MYVVYDHEIQFERNWARHQSREMEHMEVKCMQIGFKISVKLVRKTTHQ